MTIITFPEKLKNYHCLNFISIFHFNLNFLSHKWLKPLEYSSHTHAYKAHPLMYLCKYQFLFEGVFSLLYLWTFLFCLHFSSLSKRQVIECLHCFVLYCVYIHNSWGINIKSLLFSNLITFDCFKDHLWYITLTNAEVLYCLNFYGNSYILVSLYILWNWNAFVWSLQAIIGKSYFKHAYICLSRCSWALVWQTQVRSRVFCTRNSCFWFFSIDLNKVLWYLTFPCWFKNLHCTWRNIASSKIQSKTE